MTKLSITLKKEFFELLPPTIFFFVALLIVAFVRVLIMKGTGISLLSSMSIAVAALILGYPDHSARADCYVLHDARTGARDWEGKSPADILRSRACAGSVIARFRTQENTLLKTH